MILQSDWQASFGVFDPKPIVVEPQQAQFTSDAGLLPIRQLDEQLGLTAQFAAALHDPRDSGATTHPCLQMVRSRVFGIVAGYADQNDHDVLRHDPLFKLVAGRSPDGQELASQPTLSRFENAIDVASLRRLQDVLIDQFIASFSTPPLHLTFDIASLRRSDPWKPTVDLLPRLLRSVSVPPAGDHLQGKRSGGNGLPAVRHGPCYLGNRR